MAFFIFSVLMSVYISVHGPGLNFLDISLITTAVLLILSLIIARPPPDRSKKIPYSNYYREI